GMGVVAQMEMDGCDVSQRSHEPGNVIDFAIQGESFLEMSETHVETSKLPVSGSDVIVQHSHGGFIPHRLGCCKRPMEYRDQYIGVPSHEKRPERAGKQPGIAVHACVVREVDGRYYVLPLGVEPGFGVHVAAQRSDVIRLA